MNTNAGPDTLPDIRWPSAGFQWKPEWKQLLPVVRGVHAPPLPAAETWLAQALVLPDAGAHPASTYESALPRLAAAHGRPWVYWGEAGSRQRITPEALRQRDPEWWLELLAQAYAWTHKRGARMAWVASACASLHGAAFAFDRAMTLYRKMGVSDGPWTEPLLRALRQAVACAPEAEHAAAQAQAETVRLGSEYRAQACAFVFAHRQDWCAEWLEQHPDARDGALRDCAMPVATFVVRHLEANLLRMQGLQYALPGVLLQVSLHGEEALPVLGAVLHRSLSSRDAKEATLALKLAGAMHVPGVLPLLADLAEQPKVRDAYARLAARYPQAALLIALRQMLAGRNRAVEAWAVRLAHDHADALPAALAALEPAGRARFEATLAALNPTEAPPEALPPVLREPPWLQPERRGELPVLDVPVRVTPDAIVWETDQRQQAQPLAHRIDEKPPERDANGFPRALGLTAEGSRRLAGGEPLQAGDCKVLSGYDAANAIVHVPPERRALLWNGYPTERLYGGYSYGYGIESVFHQMMDLHGAAAIPGVLRYLATHAGKAPRIALLVDTPALVEPMAELLRNSRIHSRNAAAWIAKHARTTLARSLPQAFAADHSAARDNARHAIRWLAEHGQHETVLHAAQEYGGAMPQAVQAVLETDPLYLLPGEMPELPKFFAATAFRRPLLHGGAGALPQAALEHIGVMLLLGRSGTPYPGVALVKEACMPASLAEFAWDLYEAWAGAGAPSKDSWAFRALGLLGDDETARRLLTRINDWSAQPATRGRAETALDLVAAIGSDVALMVLNVLATKGRHKRVQKKATAMIAAVAAERGLTIDELGDRLVPTLGLEEEGAGTLDFGARDFSLGFDEALRPFVRDAKGARLKDLPKPNKADDAVLAAAAVECFKNLKKDVKTVASLQVTRLERAMLLRRRWNAPEFRRFFVDHPLVRHLAARVAWGVFEDGRCVHAFRVREESTLADCADREFALPDDVLVGVPHVLEIPRHDLAPISQLFADYEIAQPFRQLARETYALTPDELQKSVLTRWHDKDVACGSLLGLAQWTWQRGYAGDGGMISHYTKRANGGLVLSVSFSPGIYVAGGVPDYRQTLFDVYISREGGEGVQPSSATFADLDPVHASELVRDLELLAPARDDIA
ncbi:DUF4132 domain-containing protein [Ramlibacter sp. WS9]|uniref:DUF4132 domain-containing protein n=1 Tax=Ramlibacter sp. WS9 TaxID=1882741 RepID=UPI0011429D2F|nr:DUF4132 domain-containing protein [Ramlibacter sp. WS9]ROZ74310.1 DUF4132 domain-containing protein [Ramlibacter sp. WS9]